MRPKAPEIELKELALKLMRAAQAGDIGTLRECYTPDAKLWLNSRDAALSLDEHIKTVDAIRGRIHDLHYENIRVMPFDGGGGYVQQHRAVFTLSEGRKMEVAGCFICRVRGGKIERRDEYIDSAGLAAALKAPPG